MVLPVSGRAGPRRLHLRPEEPEVGGRDVTERGDHAGHDTEARSVRDTVAVKRVVTDVWRRGLHVGRNLYRYRVCARRNGEREEASCTCLRPGVVSTVAQLADDDPRALDAILTRV